MERNTREVIYRFLPALSSFRLCILKISCANNTAGKSGSREEIHGKLFTVSFPPCRLSGYAFQKNPVETRLPGSREVGKKYTGSYLFSSGIL